MNQTISAEKNHLKLLFIKSFVACLGVAALAGIVTLLIGKMGEIEEKILLTTCSIGVTCLLGLCCSLVILRPGLKSLSQAGIGFAILSLILTLIAIWVEGKSEIFEKSLGSVLVIAVSLAHTCLLMLNDSTKPVIKRLITATIFCITILALQFIILFWFHEQIKSDFYVRMIGVVAILDALGTIVIPIWSKTKKMEEA